MTREDFQKKYGDRLVGIVLRGFSQNRQYAGEAEQDGRAIRNAIYAVDELLREIAADLIPDPVKAPMPAPQQPKPATIPIQQPRKA